MEDLKTIETVDTSPFKHLCMTIGELPASFVDSMTYYECLAWLVNYLQKTVIPAVNNNAEATKELQAAFVTLKDYVDNYFDNLDVQEEINNKLDEMAETGELAEILAEFLSNSIYEESIECNRYYSTDKHTHYYLAKVPFNNSDNERIVLKHGFSGDVESNPIANQNIVTWGKSHNLTLAVNASVFYYGIHDPEELYGRIPGQVIHNGEVISNVPYDPTQYWADGEIWYLGLKSDGTLKKYSIHQQASELIADGVVESFVTFNQCAINGVVQSEGQFVDIDVDKTQWCLIGQNRTTKDLYLFASDGKGNYYEQGFTLREACTIMINAGADDIYRLDSGGSTEFYYKGAMLNQQTDNNFKDIRNVADYIYFEKEFTSTPMTDEMFERDRINGETLNRAKEAKYTNNFNTGVTIYRPSTTGDMVIRQVVTGTNSDDEIMALIMNSSAHPRSFAVYDEHNSRNTILVEENGTITTPNFTSADSTWVEVKDSTNTLTLYVRKITDKIVCFRGSMGGLTQNTNYTFTLPSQFSNSFEKVSVIAGNGSNTGKLKYGSNSVVTLSTLNCTELYFGVTMFRN